jgi:N-acetylglucosamine transport system substrate-binding protein
MKAVGQNAIHMRRICTSLLALAFLLVVGCSGSSGGSTAKDASKPGSLTGKLEVVAFKGGYDINFYKKAADEFQAKHPGLTVTVDGNPRVWEQLRPRFVGGNPPDLCFPGWGMDHWALAEEGQLMDLDDALSGPPAEGTGTWRDTFEPQVLKLGQLEGKQYVIPYYVMLYGWWYDPGVFAKNGWTAPKTFDDLLALSEKIKAKGIAPLTYQGMYPYYMIDGMLLPWCMSVGGPDAVKAAQNLEPGAWKSPAMLKAAQMIDELNKKGFFEKGATAMSHTESQTEFLDGKAAMIPCGTWLFSEMKKTMPPSAKMEFFLPPVLADGKGDPTSLLIGIEPWMVPSAAKNKDAAIEFYKYMTSLSVAKQFVEEKGTLMSIKGSDQGKLPDVLVKPAEALRNSKSVWAVQYRQWYPAFDKEIQNSLTAMLNGELTPEGFCDRVEAAADKTRKDDSITKHKL